MVPKVRCLGSSNLLLGDLIDPRDYLSSSYESLVTVSVLSTKE